MIVHGFDFNFLQDTLRSLDVEAEGQRMKPKLVEEECIWLVRAGMIILQI